MNVEEEFAKTVQLLQQHTIQEVSQLLQVSKSCVVKRQRVYWQRRADPAAYKVYKKQRLAVSGSRVMGRSRVGHSSEHIPVVVHQEPTRHPDTLDSGLVEQARKNESLLSAKIVDLLARGKIQDAKFRAAGNPALQELINNFGK